MFIIYTKENCPNCEQTKSVLKENKIDFEEIVIGKDITRDEVLKKFPNAHFAPIVVHPDGFEVGAHDLDGWVKFELIRRNRNV